MDKAGPYTTVAQPTPHEPRWTAFDGGMALSCVDSAKPWKILHSDFAFCALRSGAAHWAYRQRHFHVSPGAVYACEPGELHTTTRVICPGGFSVYFIEPQRVSLAAEQLGLGTQPHFKPDGLQRAKLWRDLLRLDEHVAEPDGEAFGQGMASLLANALTEALSTSSRQVRSEKELSRRVWDRLSEEFFAEPARTIRLEPIANEFGVSYYRLIHDFSKCFGAAPYELVGLLRLQYAFELLRRGPQSNCKSLTALAFRAGYSDAAHMSRSFRKHWYTTPSQIAGSVSPAWLRRSRRS